jgi:hypothetical protein
MDEYYSPLAWLLPGHPIWPGLFIAMGKHPRNRYEKSRYDQRFAGFGWNLRKAQYPSNTKMARTISWTNAAPSR